MIGCDYAKNGGPLGILPRVKSSDRRYSAYIEGGIAKEKAKHKIIIAHGFDSCKDLMLPISQMQELQIYVLQYDRDGYGESETHPKRSVKSEVFDVEELADKLQLRHRFYVVGFPWEHTLCGVV
uniref:Serine aminopeptidase S33 domain-containing protein n=1 Tax=Solanum lycopersicum TaxID=4081 RepID=K4CD59_SOLLC